MNVVIVGCGRTGAFLAELLDHSTENTVSIVDLERSAFKRLPAGFRGTPVLGDGTDMDILRQAGIEKRGGNPVLGGRGLSGPEIALVIQIHPVGDGLKAAGCTKVFHDGEKFVFAVKAAR